MLTQYEREGLVAQRQAALRREADDDRRAALLSRRAARERLAGVLVALAARLAPDVRGLPAPQAAEAGRSA